MWMYMLLKAVFFTPESKALLNTADAEALQRIVGQQEQFVSMRSIARDLIKQELTDVAKVESSPMMEARSMTMVLAPSKQQS